MGTGKTPLAAARLLAGHFIAEFAPFCERIEIAGSIRREKPEVGDIELLYVPRWHVLTTKDIFGTVVSEAREDPLDTYVQGQMTREVFTKRLNSAGRPIGYGEKNKALVHVPSGVGVDLFSTDARNWGMAMVVRTGPAEFNIAMMARFKQIGLSGHAYGGVSKGGQEIDCPDEETVFGLLGWAWMPPTARNPAAVPAVEA